MTTYQVRYFTFVSNGFYVCYPKVMSNDRTWDGRSQGDSFRWELVNSSQVTVDLINDAGFPVSTSVFAGIDTVAGDDASCNTIFTVTENGNTAYFTASGTSLNTSLTYEN